MRLLLLILFLPFLAYTQSNQQKDLSSIRNVMRDQQDAWNRADINAFMEGYWKSDSLKFIGRNGLTYGWTTTLENYKKGYPTPEAMGILTFTILHLELTANDCAFMVGKYQLKRSNDEPSGYFTLFWRKLNGKWRIVADHTS